MPKILSTLVHEMVHLQQAYNGTPSRKGYHNKEWSNMMKAVGLISSNTGKPDGNPVGQHMSHYIEPNGRFEKSCQNLTNSGFKLSWADKFGYQKTEKSIGRLKYTCSNCKLNAWAKPDILLICGACQQTLIS